MAAALSNLLPSNFDNCVTGGLLAHVYFQVLKLAAPSITQLLNKSSIRGHNCNVSTCICTILIRLNRTVPTLVSAHPVHRRLPVYC